MRTRLVAARPGPGFARVPLRLPPDSHGANFHASHRERVRSPWIPPGHGRALVPALSWIALATWLAAAVPAFALTGQIQGQVLDGTTGKALAYANVLVVGSALGAVSQEDGSFAISGIPLGPQTVQASFLGYETLRLDVQVKPGAPVVVLFRLKETLAKKEKEVLVTAERPLVEVNKASTTRSYNQEELKRLTVQPTLDSVVEQQPGVTRDNNQIHIRGGRADETLFIVDGVQMRDILTGDSPGTNISARSVAEVNIITGGFDAKYGQALSGVVEATLKEGTEEFHGHLGYQTDRATNTWKTDIYSLQLGGRLPVITGVAHLLGRDDPGKATFFLDLSTNLSNGYLPSLATFDPDTQGRALVGDIAPVRRRLRSSYEDAIFGITRRYGDFLYPRASNDWRLLLKSAWRASERNKFNVSFTKSLSFGQGFGEINIGVVNRNTISYPWSWSRRFDHYYTVTNDLNSFSLGWNHNYSTTLVSTLALTRYFSANHRDVMGRSYYQYDRLRDDQLIPEEADRPYFRDAGDATDFGDHYVENWSLSSDWIRKKGRHDVRWGLSAQYENVQYLNLNASSVDSLHPLGNEFDLFHVYPTTGAAYLQDRMEYEGVIAGLGLRYDYWFPGRQVESLYNDLYDDLGQLRHLTITPQTRDDFLGHTRSLFGHRYKGHLSPRIQVSHPITQRDHLFFNYGHFTQRPPYFYVYARSQSQPGQQFPRIGNPDLNPEVSVQYELGAGHQFSEQMAAKLSVFYKDIYDYPTSISVGNTLFIYRNVDYARSRGFELEFRKRRSHHASWAAAYGYSLAKGKSSDPNALTVVRESGGDARATNLDEQYMWWNRPHKFTVWYDYRVNKGEARPSLLGLSIPEDVSFNAYYLLQSGRAYTPTNRAGAETGQVYSKNGPIETALNGTLAKGFRFGGQKWELTLQVWNLFNHRTVLDFDPATGQAWQPGRGSLDSPDQDPANLDPAISDRQLIQRVGRAVPASAQEIKDLANQIRRAIQGTVDRYSDPSARAAPRNFRVGLSMEW